MSKASKAVNKRYFLLKIKRKYILRQIFENLQNKRKLGIIKYNQNIQKRLQVILNDNLNEYSKIEIEIIPDEYKCGKFS